MTNDIRNRYRAVRERIDNAARRAGRSPEDVRVVAVSKSFTADVLMQAKAAGIEELGENRAQELRDKVTYLGQRVRWHFIGHLQTNKVRHVVGVAVLIHSVDRFGLAEAIARRARTLGIVQDVLIEVNAAGDPSKHGVDPAQAPALVDKVAGLEGVRVRGLMTMPPYPEAPEDSRPYYRELARLSGEAFAAVGERVELSMGLSRDFEVAVQEGATIVRIGEAIFGPRRKSG